MEQKRELLLKISNQLKTMSDFVEGIERSLYVMVEMKSLESQFRHAMTGIKQTFDALSTMHEESLEPLRKEKAEIDQLKQQIQSQAQQIQKLEEENLHLKTPKKRGRKKAE